ncbi:MAG: hypothetical protein WB930_21240 [Syntrophobacteraceae bacterium]
MRRIMSALIVLAMVFALVSISGAASFPCNSTSSDNTPAVSYGIHPMCWAGYCPDMKTYLEQERRDMDKPCLTTPDPMGSVGAW